MFDRVAAAEAERQAEYVAAVAEASGRHGLVAEDFEEDSQRMFDRVAAAEAEREAEYEEDDGIALAKVLAMEADPSLAFAPAAYSSSSSGSGGAVAVARSSSSSSSSSVSAVAVAAATGAFSPSGVEEDGRDGVAAAPGSVIELVESSQE